MRRSLAFALGAVVLAPAASAHVMVSPLDVEAGSTARLTFRVPNEHPAEAIDSVSVTLLGGARVVRLAHEPGWIASSAGTTIGWRNGRIHPGESREFEIDVRFPDRRGTVGFSVLEGFATADNDTELLRATVRLREPRSGFPRLVAAAIVAGALAVAGLFVLLGRWLRG